MTCGVRPYRPSNGTEGEIFMGQWCAFCVRDSYGDPTQMLGEGEDQCEILGSAMAGDQPDEWVQRDGQGPACLAFTEDPNSERVDPAAVVAPLL